MNKSRLAAGLLCTALLSGWLPAGIVDREYQYGDDQFENGRAGNPVGVEFGGFLLTLDTIGTPNANDLNDLQIGGVPVYANTSGRPLAAAGEVGIRFDGVDDYLFGDNLNDPSDARSSIDYVDEDGNPVPGPSNYRSLFDRGFQFWVRPNSLGLGNGNAQALVLDSNQHGALISDSDTWVMRYNAADFDSGVSVDSNWHHVMVARPFGPSGPRGGARMWVDGVAVAAAGGDYANSRVELVVGANTGRDEDGAFVGGTAEFFRGEMDNLTMSVYGDSSSDPGPPPGEDYGEFDFATENEFAQRNLTGVAGDVDQSGELDAEDRNAFVAGWLQENRVNGLRTGDMNTLQNGDLNFDGITDLFDLVEMQQALIGAGMAPISADQLNAVPEPGAATLVTMGLAWLFGFARVRKIHD